MHAGFSININFLSQMLCMQMSVTLKIFTFELWGVSSINKLWAVLSIHQQVCHHLQLPRSVLHSPHWAQLVLQTLRGLSKHSDLWPPRYYDGSRACRENGSALVIIEHKLASRNFCLWPLIFCLSLIVSSFPVTVLSKSLKPSPVKMWNRCGH